MAIQPKSCIYSHGWKTAYQIIKRKWLGAKKIQGSHHILIKNERIVSVPIHGKKDIPKGTLNSILKQTGLK